MTLFNGRGTGGADFHVPREEMRIARFFCARLAREHFDQRRFALHKVLQARVDCGEIVEMMHALGVRAKFPGSLRSAQQQDAKNGNLIAVKIESFLKAVFVLGDAAVGGADGAD